MRAEMERSRCLTASRTYANRNHIAVYVSARKEAKSIGEENRKRYADRAITRNK